MLTNFSVKFDPFKEIAEITPFDHFDPDMQFIQYVFDNISGMFEACFEVHVSIDFDNRFIHVTLEGSDEELTYRYEGREFKRMRVVYAIKDLADNAGLFEWDVEVCGGEWRYPKLEKRLRELKQKKNS